MKINEVAKLAGITVRTLQYYDKIGLLHPSELTSAGYRIYDDEDLEKLWQIMFFRELDFSLSEINEFMTSPGYNKNEALIEQQELLIQKRDRLNGLIELIQNTVKGGNTMSLKKDSFKEFDMSEIEAHKKKYAKEVRERYGDTNAYCECEKKTNSYNKEQWEVICKENGDILKAFGENKQLAPEHTKIQELVKEWQDHISNNFYECTNEILSCLGIMYVDDKRFKENIDKNGEGTAKLMSEAIKIYCSK